MRLGWRLGKRERVQQMKTRDGVLQVDLCDAWVANVMLVTHPERPLFLLVSNDWRMMVPLGSGWAVGRLGGWRMEEVL